VTRSRSLGWLDVTRGLSGGEFLERVPRKKQRNGSGRKDVGSLDTERPTWSKQGTDRFGREKCWRTGCVLGCIKDDGAHVVSHVAGCDKAYMVGFATRMEHEVQIL